MFPSIAAYNQLIMNKGGSAFRQLSELSFIPSRTVPFRVFTFGSGAYAVVFKAENGGKLYAVRCFLTAENENIDRYRYITSYLKNVNASWITEINLFENEINVNEKLFPVIKMDWVDGVLLNKYVDQIKHNNQLITELQEEILKVSQSLEENKIGHGDIQSGNVVVQKDSNGKAQIKLIDYDGMYVPSLAYKTNLERGRSEFQHPKRAMLAFNEKIDRFSFWVILTALEALKYDKTLWLEVMQGGFNTLDNMLFTGTDFNNPSTSKLFGRLKLLNQNSLNFYLNKLYTFSTSYPDTIQKVSLYTENYLQEEVINEPQTSPKSSNSSDLITISSEPSGANIYTPDAVFIGTTPFVLNKMQYLNIRLTVVHLNHIKRVLILEDSHDLFVTFPQTIVQNQPLQPKETFQPKSTSNIVSSKPASTLPVSTDSDRDTFWIFIAVAILIGIIAVAILFQKNKDQYAYNSTDTIASNFAQMDSTAAPAADTTQAYTPNYYDDTAPVADTTASPIPVTNEFEISDNNEINNQSSFANKDDHGLTAEDKLYAFFMALNGRKCLDAWKITYVPEWESKGVDWFCSSSAFGSITEIKLGEPKIKTQSESEVVISVEYYSADFYGEKCFNQTFTMTLLGPTNYKSWSITNVKNNTPPTACKW